MESTKYQILKDDFYLALKDISLRNKRIKELEFENEKLRKFIKGLQCISLWGDNIETLKQLENDVKDLLR